MNPITLGVDELVTWFITSLPKLIAAVVIFVLALVVANLAARAVERASNRRKLDRETTILLSRLARYTIVVLGTVSALRQVNFDLTGFLAALGIVGFTVGFALQDISKNFVAGVLLLWQQPFDIGDDINVRGYSGVVTDISLRATEIRTADGLQVLIPNSDVYTNPVTNYSKTTRRRVALRARVTYDNQLETATKTAIEAIRQVPNLALEDPAPSVVFDNFGDQAVDFTLYYWIDTATTGFGAAQDQGVKAVKAAYEREKIALSLPMRSLLEVEASQGPLGPAKLPAPRSQDS